MLNIYFNYPHPLPPLNTHINIPRSKLFKQPLKANSL